MTNDITLRPLDSLADCDKVIELQRIIWESSDRDVVPQHVLTTVAHNGGLLMGAFDGYRMVGFVFGFLGTDDHDPHRPAMARLKLCSHQLGVLPEYQDRGVGRTLKLAQREWATKQEVRLVTWTYDPLESRNAHLNIVKLGCVCQTYLRNVYGELEDELNRGLFTDRFQVDWWITSNRVNQRIAGSRPPVTTAMMLAAGAALVNPATPDANDMPAPSEVILWPAAEAGLALVEIPSDFQACKHADQERALAWRLQTREVFERLFAEGFVVTDFIHTGRTPGLREQVPIRRSMYLLTRS